MSISEYIIETLQQIVEDVQSGQLGTPNANALELCGRIHAILDTEGE